MATQTKISLDLSQLEGFIRELGGKYVAKVGILGSDAGKTYEEGDGITVGEVGLIQEFGSVTNKIPARSFLRMPIESSQKSIIQQLGNPSVRSMVEKGNVKGVYKRMGVIAEGIIQKAFLSGGFGQWAPNAPSTIADKGRDQPLIGKEKQLYKSITSSVVKRGELNG